MRKGYQKQIKLLFSYLVLFTKIAFIIILIIFSLYHLAFANRTLPGLYVANVSLSGLDKTEVDQQLDNLDKFINTKWLLVVGDDSYQIDAETLGYSFNKDAVINELFLLGREKNIIKSFKTKLISLTYGYHLKPIYNINQQKYQEFINNVIKNATSSYKNAKFELNKSGDLVILSHQNGYKISGQQVKEVIDSRYFQFEKGEKKVLKLDTVKPKISFDMLSSHFDDIQAFLNRDFKFEYNDKFWVPSKQDKLEMVIVNSNNIEINDNQSLLLQIIKSINNPKTVEVFEAENGKVTKFVPANNGIEVDKIKLNKELIKSITDSSITTLIIPVSVLKVNKGQNEYGVKELIGSGETTYFHSAANRVYNVNLAATRVTGILVAPEEVFSFVNAVGEVSAATGYKQGYIIYNNRTILGDGGGLCQVSTTLFRAILNAGLPVISRTGHAYRVSYYEQNSDPGFDATVYVPTVDLKFKNDTGNYLLIVSESKPDKYYLKYSIYGTDDGRKVEITKPIITSVSAPPETTYQDDPTLPKGTVKQIEWATWGANVQFTRTVERESKVIYKDVFKTNYTPWASVFLVGTKE